MRITQASRRGITLLELVFVLGFLLATTFLFAGTVLMVKEHREDDIAARVRR